MILRLLCYLTLIGASILGLYGFFAYSERHLLASIALTLLALGATLHPTEPHE